MTKTPIEALQELNRLKRLKDAGLPYSVEEKQQAWKDAYEAEANHADNGWLPIESAPRDGTGVILLYDNYLPVFGEFREGSWYTMDFFGKNNPVPPLYFSYWMPLPAPPKTGDE